jgi:hypothetical protein
VAQRSELIFSQWENRVVGVAFEWPFSREAVTNGTISGTDAASFADRV